MITRQTTQATTKPTSNANAAPQASPASTLTGNGRAYGISQHGAPSNRSNVAGRGAGNSRGAGPNRGGSQSSVSGRVLEGNTQVRERTTLLYSSFHYILQVSGVSDKENRSLQQHPPPAATYRDVSGVAAQTPNNTGRQMYIVPHAAYGTPPHNVSTQPQQSFSNVPGAPARSDAHQPSVQRTSSGMQILQPRAENSVQPDDLRDVSLRISPCRKMIHAYDHVFSLSCS